MNDVVLPYRQLARHGDRNIDVLSEAVGRLGMSEPSSMLRNYLSMARRRKWTILGCITGALIIGVIATLLITPTFVASSSVEIQRETRNFTDVEGAESTSLSSVDQEFYQTQYGLLGARSLSERIASDLKLTENAKFFEMLGKRSNLRDWFENGKVKPGASTRQERLAAAGKALLDHVEIDPERMSRIVKISFESPDAAFSQAIANRWAETFITTTLERRFEATSYARRFLEKRLAQLQRRIDESERTLVGYAAREGIVNLPSSTPTAQEDGAGISGERSLVADNLASLNRELSRATADRVEAESRLSVTGDAAKEALDNQAISLMRGRRADLSADYAKLITQFQPGYPAAVAVKNQLRELETSIAREESRIKNSLRETYRSSLQRESDLQNRVASLKADMLDLRKRSIQYNIYQREADTNRQLYVALLQRYKEIGVAGGVGVNNISIIDRADLPRLPASPRLSFNLALALLAGLLVGLAAAVVLEQIDEGISDPATIEGSLGTPLLGTIPKADGGQILDVLDDRKSPVAEAYLSLQTNLGFATAHGIPKTFAVTSSRPSEGKSTTSFALALSMARSGRRVLLMDGDLRSPSVHTIVGTDNTQGLSNFLSGDDDFAKLVRPTSRENLFVVTAGPQPPSAAELLSGDRLNQIIAAYAELFDHVIIDMPPVMGLADAPLIGSRVEGTIFVVESNATKRSVARVAASRLKSTNIHLLGAVLTKFDPRRSQNSYGYDYGYGYGYGQIVKADS